ncbi:MAG: type II toxin-antitoxin system VapC family toxin [Syntrophomonas sp.]|nr:type II toxin-antitoxin system VapC family toxin [Syntrophomonas sp.]
MEEKLVIYWDTSAILSALFKDVHSQEAWNWSRREGLHLLSSLAAAETYAVINRIHRERNLPEILVKAALEAFEQGPWHSINMNPDNDQIKRLGSKWPLRGADLWHLAMTCTLTAALPEIRLLTFDQRLGIAARGEKIKA